MEISLSMQFSKSAERDRSDVVKSRRRVDLLKTELRHGRVSPEAFWIGRRLQQHFEAGSGGEYRSPWPNGPRVDCSPRQADPWADFKQARARVAFEQWVEGMIGRDGLRDLKVILADGLTFAECAAQDRKTGERAVRKVAKHFRQRLQQLAEGWAREPKSAAFDGAPGDILPG